MPAGSILVADDDTAIRTVLNQALSRAGYEVRLTGNAATLWRWVSQGEGDLVITDVVMPDENAFDLLPRIKKIRPNLPVIVMSAQNTFMTAIRASERGAYEYLPKPFDLKELIAIVGRALAEPKERVANHADESEFDSIPLVGRSPAMQEIYRVLARLMQTDLTVMISGESGTGKELVARALHDYGKRRNGPFVAVNMAAIPRDLIESELFGHERGAFTGATTQRIGKFEQCNQGTIFLDEIGDMTPATQTKILRVLQSGTFERVGGNSPIQVDVRVIAATNKPLEAAVAAKQFREDLFYRLNVVRIHIAPLRDRRDDIPLLVNYFLKKLAREHQRAPKSIATSVIKTLEKYHWPGNVRELENAIHRAHVMAKSDAILSSDLPPEISGQSGSGAPPPAASVSEAAATDAAAIARQLFQWARRDPKLKIIPAVERELVVQALKETNDNQIQAAKLLGITRATLRKRIEKFGIQRELNVK